MSVLRSDLCLWACCAASFSRGFIGSILGACSGFGIEQSPLTLRFWVEGYEIEQDLGHGVCRVERF